MLLIAGARRGPQSRWFHEWCVEDVQRPLQADIPYIYCIKRDPQEQLGKLDTNIAEAWHKHCRSLTHALQKFDTCIVDDGQILQDELVANEVRNTDSMTTKIILCLRRSSIVRNPSTTSGSSPTSTSLLPTPNGPFASPKGPLATPSSPSVAPHSVSSIPHGPTPASSDPSLVQNLKSSSKLKVVSLKVAWKSKDNAPCD